MKNILLIFSCFLFSLFTFSQEKNCLFGAYSIGDPITKNFNKVICYGNVDSKIQSLSECKTRRFIYNIQAEDSINFPLVKFDIILLVTDNYDKVISIWLLKPEMNDSSFSTIDKFQESIQQYLNLNLKVKPEVTKEYPESGGIIKGLLWRSEHLNYHLKLTFRKNKKSEKPYKASINIY